jgi:hypothetical protein
MIKIISLISFTSLIFSIYHWLAFLRNYHNRPIESENELREKLAPVFFFSDKYLTKKDKYHYYRSWGGFVLFIIFGFIEHLL